jgi:hypothetical protein
VTERALGGSAAPAIDMHGPTPGHPRAGDIVVYKRPTSGEICLMSVFKRASPLSFRTRREARRDAVTSATLDHVDAWYTEDGQAYERMAAHRVQGGRRAIS